MYKVKEWIKNINLVKVDQKNLFKKNLSKKQNNILRNNIVEKVVVLSIHWTHLDKSYQLSKVVNAVVLHLRKSQGKVVEKDHFWRNLFRSLKSKVVNAVLVLKSHLKRSSQNRRLERKVLSLRKFSQR